MRRATPQTVTRTQGGLEGRQGRRDSDRSRAALENAAIVPNQSIRRRTAMSVTATMNL